MRTARSPRTRRTPSAGSPCTSLALALPALLAGLAPAARAQCGELRPLGPAYTPAQDTNWVQFEHAVDSRFGRTVYAWTHQTDVYVRYFDLQDQPLGDVFQLNLTHAAGAQDQPAVSIGVDGRVLLVYDDREDGDGELQGLFGRVYDLDGAPLFPEFVVNETWQASQWKPKLAAMPGGGWAVAFNGDFDGNAYLRVFDADGQPLTGDVGVNTKLEWAQVDASVAVGGFGAIFVTYLDKDPLTGLGNEVHARTFTPAGAPVQAAEFPVASTTAPGDQWGPKVAALSGGRYVVAWESIGTDGDGSGIYARVFDALGNAQGPEWRVNTTTTGDQRDLAIDADQAGNFWIVWLDSSVGSPRLVGQRYDAAASPVGGEFPVGTDHGKPHSAPSLAMTPDGRHAIVAYTEDVQPYQDVQARHWAMLEEPVVFCASKPNQNGCRARIATSGAPSATAGSGFTISADLVLNNTNGILFYGHAADALPFQGGVRCVAAPLQRTTAQSAGGNPPPSDCSGTFAVDFNAWVQLGVDPSLVAGATLFAQFYYRDLGDPFGTGLTDAVAFTLCP